MSDLTKQTVAIVGASSGIGLAAAKAAAQHGADVAMLSRSAGKLEEARKGVSESARAIAVDMLDRESVARAVASIGTISRTRSCS